MSNSLLPSLLLLLMITGCASDSPSMVSQQRIPISYSVEQDKRGAFVYCTNCLRPTSKTIQTVNMRPAIPAEKTKQDTLPSADVREEAKKIDEQSCQPAVAPVKKTKRKPRKAKALATNPCAPAAEQPSIKPQLPRLEREKATPKEIATEVVKPVDIAPENLPAASPAHRTTLRFSKKWSSLTLITYPEYLALRDAKPAKVTAYAAKETMSRPIFNTIMRRLRARGIEVVTHESSDVKEKEVVIEY